ncbi:hypothetical protein AK812_SmicGene1675 [Symbiodinium microadriaticum]|uniref:Uncharacterized protein n=1 Tax=Symbiodinium microadriaticum TaxID=2951 RepID=A0A1Q9F3E1_SYMMI|nr:hypothetical protein AK812_SmicGene1675 [Symbiodinium microadriaticum]
MALELMYGTLNGDPFEDEESKLVSSQYPSLVVLPEELSKLQPDERDRAPLGQTICWAAPTCLLHLPFVPGDVTGAHALNLQVLAQTSLKDSDVDFDLAAFHALVRQLVEGALANILLKVKLLPKGFMCASPQKVCVLMDAPGVREAFTIKAPIFEIM